MCLKIGNLYMDSHGILLLHFDLPLGLLDDLLFDVAFWDSSVCKSSLPRSQGWNKGTLSLSETCCLGFMVSPTKQFMEETVIVKMDISPESAYKWPFQSPMEWTTGRTLTLPALVMPKGPKKEEAEAMIVQCRTNILNIRKDKTNISAHRCRWSTVYHPIGAIHCKTWYLISDW